MADLIARALGRAALRKAAPERECQKRFNDMRLEALRETETVNTGVTLRDFYTPEVIERLINASIPPLPKAFSEFVQDNCFEDLAAVVGAYYPDMVVSGPAFRERLEQFVRDSDILSELRLKYGWHDASKVLPNHSRHVLVWTQRGEYRAWYDHVCGCWRVHRDGLNITHWREQCGPKNWPAAK